VKRVLLDENVDWRLKRSIDPSFEVTTVTERGWSGLKNGELLRVASAAFDVLVTLDRNMQHQQRLSDYDLAVVLVLARSSRRQDIEPVMPEVNRAIRAVQSGSLVIVPTA